MKSRILVNCDDVFERLTSGPFPVSSTRASDEPHEQAYDMRVQSHIDSCHECRMLAESLRPTVGLLTTAIEDPQLQTLPVYRGVEGSTAIESPQSKVGVPIADSQRRLRKKPWEQSSTLTSKSTRTNSWWAFGQALAVFCSCLGLAACLSFALQSRSFGLADESSNLSPFEPISDGIPSPRGIALLYDMAVSNTCLQQTTTGFDNSANDMNLSIDQNVHSAPYRVDIAQNNNSAPRSSEASSIKCCTTCHTATSNNADFTTRSRKLLRQSCAVCHIWP